MGWDKRDPVTNLVILGDEGDHKRKVGGLLAGIHPDRTYPDKVSYELIQRDGEAVTLSGSASLARRITDRDVGKFIKCEFTGWGTSPNGRFKMIDVYLWEEEPTPEMKKWPRWAELNAPKNGNDDAFAAVGGTE